MNLLFLAPSAYLLGGVQVWLADLVPGLRQRNWQVQVALASGHWHDVAAYSRAFPELPVVAVANPTGSEEGRLRSIGRLLQERQPDLVAGVNIAALYPAVARLRRQGSFRGRTVMTLHGLEADLLANLAAQRQVIDAVIASNRLTCALCRTEAGLQENRVLYAPYGVAVDPQPSPPSTGGPLAGPLRIAWIGRLSEEQKRVLDLPAILAELDRRGLAYRLSIAGDGPDFAATERVLAPWIGRGTVRLLGRLDAEALRQQVYSGHDALLITSSWETGPIVAWEAMAAGLAVVSSRYVGHRLEGSLEHGVNALLFDVGDVRGAADQLVRLTDPERSAALVAEGHRLVMARYTREASLAAWERAFLEALALDPLPPPYPGQPLPVRGRLDRWLGAARAEDLRQLLDVRFVHPEAGAEWPHADREGGDESMLLRRAAALEAFGQGGRERQP
ncbi:glycosyltransferase family 4 protein [Cyanobium sp. FGCU-6]|nr:glycosyltransferase family 4 protein [Cyanobium sp. FGCU6]